MTVSPLPTKDVALVLSSGGPRGFAYIGAIEELERRGYRITSVAGSSIGSLVGGIYAAGCLREFKEWLYNLTNFQVMRLLDISAGRAYLIKGQRVISAIKEVVPDISIEDLNIPYVAVATDLYTGEQHVFRQGKLFDAIRASISIPSLFQPVHEGYHTLIDGGLVSTFPLGLVQRSGHDLLVGFDVNTTDPDEINAFLKNDFQKREETSDRRRAILERIGSGSTLMEKVRAISDEGEQLLKNRVRRRDVSEVEATPPIEGNAEDSYVALLTRSFAIANHTIARLETEIYKPDVLATMSFDSYGDLPDYTKAEEIAEKGRRIMSDALDRYENGI